MSTTERMSADERLSQVLQEEALGERALRTILKREGYDPEEISAAVKKVDWDAQAELAGEQEADVANMPLLLFLILKARGFHKTQASQIAYGTDDPDSSETPDMLPLEARIWSDLAAAPADKQMPAVRDEFGDTAASRDEKTVRQALAGDLRARCRIMAASLLDTGISRSTMQETLTGAGFPSRLVREQIRDLKPNWKVQCCLVAEQLAMQTPEREEIQDGLREQGFTPVQVAYALNTAHLRDDEAAKAYAHLYVSEEGQSVNELRSEMEAMGFTPEQVELAVADVDGDTRDWVETGAAVMRSFLETTDTVVGGPDRFAQAMLIRGYTREQVEAASEGFDWARRADQDYERAFPQGLTRPKILSRRGAREAIEEMGYSAETAEQAVELHFAGMDEMAQALAYSRLSAEMLGSPEALRSLLETGGFTPEETEWIMNRVFIDPLEGAAATWEAGLAELIRDGIIPSPQDMRSFLEDEGFEKEIVDRVMTEVFPDWSDLAVLYAMNLRAEEMSENDIRTEMAEEKFHLDTVERALAQTRGTPPETAAALVRVAVLTLRMQQLGQSMEMAQAHHNAPETHTFLIECADEMQSIVDELETLGISIGSDEFPHF